MINSVYNKIKRQVKKNPFKTYIKISHKKYSENEMKAIKLFFCDYNDFYFSLQKIDNPLYNFICPTELSISANSTYTIATTATVKNYNLSKPKKIIVDKFYIYWMKEIS